MLLFSGKSAVSDTGKFSFESGTGKSATGKLNPDIFADGKSPLQKAGSRLTLNLFDSTSFTADVDSSQSLGPGRFTAFGTIEGIEGSSFIATAENKPLSALVTLPNLGTYRIESAGNDTYRAVLQNAYAPACPPAPVPKIKLDPSAPAKPLPKIAAGPVTVDIAIVYTAPPWQARTAWRP